MWYSGDLLNAVDAAEGKVIMQNETLVPASRGNNPNEPSSDGLPPALTGSGAFSLEKLMVLTNIISDDPGLVIYRPKLNEITGSVTATILLQQILYWFKQKGGKPFFKFKEPCGHKLYKEGDSWCEELGFSRREFDTALEKIGQKVAKGIPLDHSKLIWYWTDIGRTTHYKVNTDLCEKVLIELYSGKDQNVLYVKADSAVTKSANAPIDKQRLTTETTTDTNTYIPEPSETKSNIVEVEKHNVAKFEECWKAFGRYGAKGKALAYWKKLSPEERNAVERAIPAYMAVVSGGRYQKQFEGWINPQNRLWEMNYGGRAAPSKWNGISLDDI